MKPYRRKLSAEDAECGTILITKGRCKVFPPPIEEFTVRVGRRPFATQIVDEGCVCVPPPHLHMHLESGHLRHVLDFSKGAIVEIEIRDHRVRSIRNG